MTLQLDFGILSVKLYLGRNKCFKYKIPTCDIRHCSKNNSYTGDMFLSTAILQFQKTNYWIVIYFRLMYSLYLFLCARVSFSISADYTRLKGISDTGTLLLGVYIVLLVYDIKATNMYDVIFVC